MKSKKAYTTILSQTNAAKNLPTRLRKRFKAGGPAQQAAIAIAMKKAGKTPKQKKKGGTKGYPKSDSKDFMKRMGYYEAGGLSTSPMYGPNLMPGSQETSFIAYNESDPETLKLLEEDIKKQELDDSEIQQAKADIAEAQQKTAQVETTAKSGIKKLSKELTTNPIINLAGSDPSLIKSGADLYGMGTTPGITAAAPKGVASIVNPATGEAMSLLPGAPVPEGFIVEGVSGGGKLGTGLLKTGAKLKQGLSNIGQATAGTGAAKAGEFMTKSLINTGSQASGLASSAASLANPAAIASLVGMGVKKLSDDADPTTFNAGEATGSILSGAGTGAGIGSLILPGVGTLAGALIGGAYSGIKGAMQAGKFGRMQNRAEAAQESRINKARAKARMEEIKDKEYSGFDLGSDLNARYGGLRYDDGGEKINLHLPSLKARGSRFNIDPYLISGTRPGIAGGRFSADIPISKSLNINPSIDTSGKGSLGVSLSFEHGGVKQLPGGTMEKIPGTDAVEFKGQSHEEGGIMLDEQTEVEGGETMDQVTMARKGGKRGNKRADYFFSDHLKLGGKSFAARHKQILEMGGSQKDIDALAKLQEEKAGRNPNTVKAKVGGVRKFKTGGNVYNDEIKNAGFTEAEHIRMVGMGFEFNPATKTYMKPENITTTSTTDNTTDEAKDANIPGNENTTTENTTETESVAFPFTNKEEGNKFRAWMAENYPEYRYKNDKLDREGSFNNSFMKDAWSKYGNEYNTKVLNPPPKIKTMDEIEKEYNETGEIPNYEDWSKAWSELNPGKTVPTEEMFTKMFTPITDETIRNSDLPVTDPAHPDYKKPSRDLTDAERRALSKIYQDIPTAAIIGGAAQMLPSLYAFLRKPGDPEQMQAPGRLKSPSLERISLNKERAANTADNRAINRFIETSGGGPANIAAKMAAYSKKQEGDMKIAAAETKANVAIANQEAQLKAQADARNVANRLTVDQVNTKLREASRLGNIDQKLMALDTASQNIAGMTGDYLSYKASGDLARATGDMGIFERQRLRQLLKGQINPTTGKPYTDPDIAEIFNISINEPVATNTTTNENEG